MEIFETLFEAKVLIERWRKEYNAFRPHSSLEYLPPAPEVVDRNSNFKDGTNNGVQYKGSDSQFCSNLQNRKPYTQR